MTVSTKKPKQQITGEALELDPKVIGPSPFQHRTFTKADDQDTALLSMAESMKEVGVIEPLIVRAQSVKALAAKHPFELIAGERRLRASRMAKLEKVPVILVVRNDQEARQIQLIENLQREGVHPLDEAQAYADLIASQTPPMEMRELGRRVGHDEKTIARRLTLLSLIPQAKMDFRANLITAGHAMEISRLSPEVQADALNACYEQDRRWDQKSQRQISTPDKKQPPISVKRFVDWINEHVILDLAKAPWDLEDAELVPAQGACSNCAFNTGANRLLFSDAKATVSLCTNPEGYKRKRLAFVERAVVLATQKDEGRAPECLTDIYSVDANDRRRHSLPDNALSRDSFEVVTSKASECEHTHSGVYWTGPNVGKTVRVCAVRECQTHQGRRSGSTKSAAGQPKSAKEIDEKNKRKQELFDLRVNEPVRLKVFAAMLPQFKSVKQFAADKLWLIRMVAELWTRMPVEDQRTIGKLLPAFNPDSDDADWNDHDYNDQRNKAGKLIEKLLQTDDQLLAQFMAACSVVHYGENRYMAHTKDQADVVALAGERGIDYGLLDAEVRHEQAPRKYKAVHAAYLEAVQAGETAPPPRVYEVTATPTAPVRTKTSPSAKSGTKKPAKKASKAPAKPAKKKPVKKR